MTLVLMLTCLGYVRFREDSDSQGLPVRLAFLFNFRSNLSNAKYTHSIISILPRLHTFSLCETSLMYFRRGVSRVLDRRNADPENPLNLEVPSPHVVFPYVVPSFYHNIASLSLCVQGCEQNGIPKDLRISAIVGGHG